MLAKNYSINYGKECVVWQVYQHFLTFLPYHVQCSKSKLSWNITFFTILKIWMKLCLSKMVKIDIFDTYKILQKFKVKDWSKSNVLALFLTINILTVLKTFTRLNPFAFQNWKKITYPKFEIYLFNKQQFWNFSQIKSFDSSEICKWVDMGLWNKLKSSSKCLHAGLLLTILV